MKGRCPHLLLIALLAGSLFSNQPSAYSIDYTYDDLNRLIRVERDNGTVIEYEYDASGNRTRKKVTECTLDEHCDDGQWCNGVETCVAESCVPGTSPCVDDGQFCNGSEICNDDTDQCQSTGNPCTPDGNVCSDDNCVEETDTCEYVCNAVDNQDPCCVDPICAGQCLPETIVDVEGSYSGGNLNLSFTLATPEPSVWGAFLILTTPSVQVLPLWTPQLPAIPNPINIPVGFPFPNLGWIGIYTGLYTAEGVQGADFVWVNSG